MCQSPIASKPHSEIWAYDLAPRLAVPLAFSIYVNVMTLSKTMLLKTQTSAGCGPLFPPNSGQKILLISFFKIALSLSPSFQLPQLWSTSVKGFPCHTDCCPSLLTVLPTASLILDTGYQINVPRAKQCFHRYLSFAHSPWGAKQPLKYGNEIYNLTPCYPSKCIVCYCPEVNLP